MTLAYLTFLVLGIAAFFLTAKFGLATRFAIALAAFFIPSIVLTVWVARVGDRPMPDAITVVPAVPNSDKADSNDPDAPE